MKTTRHTSFDSSGPNNMESDRTSEDATDDGKEPDKDVIEYFDGFGCSVDDASAPGSSAPRNGRRDDATRYIINTSH
jgi:hypothetical protein